MEDNLKRYHALFIQHNLPITSIKELPGGYNCSMYVVTVRGSQKYVLKQYHFNEDDNPTRLFREFNSYVFLRAHAQCCVPKPIFMSEKLQVGVYEYLDGDQYRKQLYTYRDCIPFYQFWSALHLLSKQRDAQKLPNAKEACFSIQQAISITETRLGNIQNMLVEKNVSDLVKQLQRSFHNVRSFISSYESKYARISNKLDDQYKTLSPSDFGFHNAVQTKQGVMFYDFEYFGWDDPAKMLSDFYLHPRMNITLSAKEKFYRLVYNTVGDKDLSYRLALYYAIFSFKWALIMLNGVVHNHSVPQSSSSLEQIRNSRLRLERLQDELSQLPFPLSLL